MTPRPGSTSPEMELQNLMASRAGSIPPETEPKNLVVRRKRASTKKLLGAEYKDEIKLSDIPPAPKPTSTYDIPKLRQRLYWVDCVLRDTSRKISPIRGYQLAVYKNACADALHSELAIEAGEVPIDEIEERRVSWAAGLRVFEESNEYLLCLAQTQTTDAHELQDKMLELLTLNFYARYGDLLASACKLLRFKAQQMNVEGASLLRGFWSDIDRKLTLEKDAFKDMMRTHENNGECPLHFTINKTCIAIGFELENMLNIIHVYAMRNELMHTNLLPLIREGKISTLAKILQEDLNDLPKVIPRERGVEVQVLQQLVTTLIDYWFIKKAGHEDNYERWTASDALDEFIDKVENSDPAKEAAEWESASRRITEVLAERLQKKRASEGMEDLVRDVDKMYTLVTAERAPKRVASSQLEAEKMRVKRATNLWRILSTSVHKAHKLATEYEGEFGELCAPPSGVVHDPT